MNQPRSGDQDPWPSDSDSCVAVKDRRGFVIRSFEWDRDNSFVFGGHRVRVDACSLDLDKDDYWHLCRIKTHLWNILVTIFPVKVWLRYVYTFFNIDNIFYNYCKKLFKFKFNY